MEVSRPEAYPKPEYHELRKALEARKLSLEKQMIRISENERQGITRDGEDDHLVAQLEIEHEEVLKKLMALELPDDYAL